MKLKKVLNPEYQLLSPTETNIKIFIDKKDNKLLLLRKYVMSTKKENNLDDDFFV